MFNRMLGKTRYVVCRLFVHLSGSDVAPILGVLNTVARDAVDDEGDIETVGEGLARICQSLIEYDDYWTSASNEGDVFWSEGEAGDFVNELFTDSAQRYLSEPDFTTPHNSNEPLAAPATRNVIVMLTAAFEGEVPELETDLSNIQALKEGLKALINVYHKNKLRAAYIHFSPAQFGDELTDDQILQHYPELIRL